MYSPANEVVHIIACAWKTSLWTSHLFYIAAVQCQKTQYVVCYQQAVPSNTGNTVSSLTEQCMALKKLSRY